MIVSINTLGGVYQLVKFVITIAITILPTLSFCVITILFCGWVGGVCLLHLYLANFYCSCSNCVCLHTSIKIKIHDKCIFISILCYSILYIYISLIFSIFYLFPTSSKQTNSMISHLFLNKQN